MNSNEKTEIVPGPVHGIYYKREVGRTGARDGYFLFSGKSLVVISCGHPGDRSEIGLYEKILDPTAVRRAHQILLDSRYKDIPTAKAYPPDTKFVLFQEERKNDEAASMTAFPLKDVPPAITPVMQEMEQLIDVVREHPVRVARVGARWIPGVIKSNEELGLEITFENIGTHDVVLGHPLRATSGSPTARLHLALVPQAGSSMSLKFDATNIVDDGSEHGRDVIALQPGQKRALHVSKRVFLAPGKYQGLLTYVSHLKYRPGEPALRGEVYLELGRLEVTGERP